MADIEFTIERAGYTTIRLDSDTVGAYGLQASTQGFGVGPIIPRFREGAGDGVQFDGDKAGAKAMDLGVIIRGANRPALGVLIRDLRNIMRARQGKPLPRLVASGSDGTILEVPFLYTSGLEIEYTKALPTVFATVIGVLCPDPFWIARDAQSFSVQNTSVATPFLDDLANLPVAASSVIGSVTVANPGDVPADLTVTIQGPSTGNTTVLVNGVGWVYTVALASTDVITVTRGPLGVTVKDQTGANKYANLGSAPKFPQLDPGSNVIDVTMVGATTASRVSGFWKPRFEGIY